MINNAKRNKGVIIGKFLKELSIFDYKFATTGGLFCITFAFPYPKLIIGEQKAIVIEKTTLTRHNLPVCKFKCFAPLAREISIKQAAAHSLNRKVFKASQAAPPPIFSSNKINATKEGIYSPPLKRKRKKASDMA